MKCQDPSPCSVRLQSTESLGTVHVLNGRCALAGETQEDHQELVDFVKVLFVLGLDLCLMALGLTFDPWSDRWVDLRPSLRTLFAMPGEMRFERAGIFAYSEEEGTPAATLPNQVQLQYKRENRMEHGRNVDAEGRNQMES
eukprot:1865251-Rhodomonas_salina.1